MTPIDPRGARAFRFVRRDYDADRGALSLVYAFDDGPELIEEIVFPSPPPLSPARAAAFAAALDLVHWIAGVSYYKAGTPPALVLDRGVFDLASAALLTRVYTDGLAEFAHQNRLDLESRVHFECPEAAPLDLPRAPALGLAARALVPIGGGKDSLVSVEALKLAGADATATWIGASPLIEAVAVRTRLPRLNIRRTLAPALFEMNRAGAYNGHIPVTAINSAILIAAALLYDFGAIVFSNERSASAPTLERDGRAVNHQWSKGLLFEELLRDWIARFIASDLEYSSLLRDRSELAVTERFARLTRYHDVFSSCNRNFRILGERPESRWCGRCPKCHFVFLALAPFVAKPALMKIFGRNLLDDPANAAGFDGLIEWHADKPFECVGEAVESRAALIAIANRPEWREDELVARFARDIAPAIAASTPPLATHLGAGGPSYAPRPWRDALDALR